MAGESQTEGQKGCFWSRKAVLELLQGNLLCGPIKCTSWSIMDMYVKGFFKKNIKYAPSWRICTNSPFKSVLTVIEAIRPDPRKKLDLSNLSNSPCSCLRKIEMKEGIYDFFFWSSKNLTHWCLTKTATGQGWSRLSLTHHFTYRLHWCFLFSSTTTGERKCLGTWCCAEIALWLWHSLTKAKETPCQCSHTILWRSNCGKENALGRDRPGIDCSVWGSLCAVSCLVLRVTWKSCDSYTHSNVAMVWLSVACKRHSLGFICVCFCMIWFLLGVP